MIFEKIETAKEIYHSIKCENITKFKPPEAICENNTGYGTRGNIPIPSPSLADELCSH